VKEPDTVIDGLIVKESDGVWEPLMVNDDEDANVALMH